MLKTGRVLSNAVRFSDGNQNPTFKGSVLTNESIIICYYKFLQPFEIAIEYICSLIAIALKLPVPDPIIVIADHDVINEIPEGVKAIGFGSVDVNYPSFKRRFPNYMPYIRMLVGFPEVSEVSAFDEWIINTDRNLGNILYDGGDNVYFIDHGMALRLLNDPKMISPTNKVVLMSKEVLEKDELNDKYRYIETEFIPKVAESIISDAISDDFVSTGLLTKEQAEYVRAYLRLRIPYLVPILMKEYDVPQMELSL